MFYPLWSIDFWRALHVLGLLFWLGCFGSSNCLQKQAKICVCLTAHPRDQMFRLGIHLTKSWKVVVSESNLINSFYLVFSA
jgi:hypothetical protein